MELLPLVECERRRRWWCVHGAEQLRAVALVVGGGPSRSCPDPAPAQACELWLVEGCEALPVCLLAAHPPTSPLTTALERRLSAIPLASKLCWAARARAGGWWIERGYGANGLPQAQPAVLGPGWITSVKTL